MAHELRSWAHTPLWVCKGWWRQKVEIGRLSYFAHAMISHHIFVGGLNGGHNVEIGRRSSIWQWMSAPLDVRFNFFFLISRCKGYELYTRTVVQQNERSIVVPFYLYPMHTKIRAYKWSKVYEVVLKLASLGLRLVLIVTLSACHRFVHVPLISFAQKTNTYYLRGRYSIISIICLSVSLRLLDLSS